MGKKILLSEDQIPKQWYNLTPDLPGGFEFPLDPATRKPMRGDQFAAIFPAPLIEQELSTERWIDIPEEVRKIWSIWRPTPLVRADLFEKAINSKARIYFKNESASPAGSHKGNTATAQAYYNSISGVRKVSTETGGGQWGSALALACKHFDLECLVFMVRISYKQKPYRHSMMRVWGATVYPSPSDQTEAGRAILKDHPDHPGSLGIAISEAVEVAAGNNNTCYSLGSVLNHVLLHQTVIGLEAKEQLKLAGEKADIIISCCGGGSNFAGIAFPFVQNKLHGENCRLIGVEPAACPTLTRGQYTFDHGDTAHLTPLLRMHTLGAEFVPPGIHAGGLRFHGMAPLVSALYRDQLMEVVAVTQTPVFQAAVTFAQTEGIIPAPESAHSIAQVIVEAQKEENRDKVILFNLTGHGLLDMFAYDKYFSGEIEDYNLDDKVLQQGFHSIPVPF